MKLQIVFSVILFSAFLFSLNPSKRVSAKPEDLTGTISISGSFALYPMAVKWGEEFKKLHPKVRVDISAGGSGKGIADALAGVIDIGTASRDIYPEEIKKGAFSIAVAKDAVVPTISAANPYIRQIVKKGLSKPAFQKVWIDGKYKTWGQILGIMELESVPVHVYTRSDASGAAETWAKYLGKKQEDLLGIGVYGDPGMAQALRNDPQGIGYNNRTYVFDPETKKVIVGFAVIPIKSSPPARDLFFLTRGKPAKKKVLEFIRWVLTGGQKYVHESGYIALSKKELAEQLKKLR